MEKDIELDFLDDDLKKICEEIGTNNIVPGLPAKLQLIRLLRNLIAVLKNINNGINNCSNCKNNVKT